MSVAPDYAAPLVGWRIWAAVEEEGGLRLRSVTFKSRWPPREHLDAVCRQLPRSRLLARVFGVQPHEAPEAGCECGIYAARAPDLALPYLGRLELMRGVKAALIGRVALWGRVIECERGWRGAFAYPSHLYLLRARLSRRERPHARALADELAVYGVPVGVLEASALETLLADLAAEEAALFDAA